MSKKIFAVITTITCAVMMIGPGFAPVRAADLSGITAELEDLCQTYYNLAGTVYPGCEDYTSTDGSVTPPVGGDNDYEGIPDGFTFENNLKYGMSGDEVKYLQIVLKAEVGAPTYPDTVGATGWFGPVTRSSVIEFQEDYATDVLAPWGLTSGTGFVGGTTRDKLNEFLASDTTPPPPVDEPSDYDNENDCDDAGYYWFDDACHANEQPADEFDNEDDCDDAGYYWYNDECNESAESTNEGDLTIELSDDNPVSGYILVSSSNGSYQHQKPMVAYEMTAVEDTTVEEITFTKGGFASDGDISELYLYVDGELIAETPSNISTKKFVFSTPFDVDAGETADVELRVDMDADTTASTVVNFGLASGDDIDAGDVDASGDFPLNGNSMTVANVTLASVTITTETTGDGVKVGENSKELAKIDVAVSNDITIHSMTFPVIGSLASGDLANFEFQDKDGDVVASVDVMTTAKEVVFTDLNIELDGDETYYIYGDVEGGALRNFEFTGDESYYFNITDDENDVRIYSTLDDEGSVATIASGDFKVELSDDSPIGSVPLDGDNVVLARYEFTAGGERTKIESLGLQNVADTGGVTLTDVKVLVNGSQKGDTDDSLPTDTDTEFDFGNSFVIGLGETAIVEIVADLDDATVITTDEFHIADDTGGGATDDIQYKLLDSNTSADTTLPDAFVVNPTSAEVDASISSATPEGQIMAMGTTREVGRWTVETYNDDVEIRTVDFTNATSTGTFVGNVNKAKLVLYDSDGDEIASEERSIKNATSAAIWFGNSTDKGSYDDEAYLAWDMEQDETYYLALEYTFRSWASTDSGADTGAELTATLNGFDCYNSTSDPAAVSGGAANTMLVRRSMPTITLSGDAAAKLSSGAEKTLYSFNLTADEAGKVAFKRLVYTVDFTADGTDLIIDEFKFFRGGTELTDVTIYSEDGEDLTVALDNTKTTATTKVIVTLGGEEELNAGDSYDYKLKATIAGVTDNDEISIVLADDTTKRAPTGVVIFAATGDATAAWSMAQAKTGGTYSVEFELAAADNYAYAQTSLLEGLAFADISTMSYSYYVDSAGSTLEAVGGMATKDGYTSSAVYQAPYLSFQIDDTGDGVADGGFVQHDVAVTTSIDAWEVDTIESTEAFHGTYGNGDKTFAELKVLYPTAKVISIWLQTAKNGTVEADNNLALSYVDDIIINGVTYPIELDNFTWSDESVGNSHDGDTADWTNGYMVDDLATTEVFLSE